MSVFTDKLDRLEKDIEKGIVWVRMSKRISKENPRCDNEFMKTMDPRGRFIRDEGRQVYFYRPAYPQGDERSEVDYIKRIKKRGGGVSIINTYFRFLFVLKDGMPRRWGDKNM